MAVFYDDFIHPSDKKALDALKAVPGFDLVLKKCMSMLHEKIFKIEFTSSFLRLGPNQLPEIYNILLKVCRKLDIAVPELYLSLDRSVNAYTTGDTDVFIVVNSGLIETLTMEQIETVIAHECGHIVCHHVLYHSLGRMLIEVSDFFANNLLSKAAIGGLLAAYYYWNRCSEFSADRVSCYYHGSAEPVVELMMALSGGTNNLGFELNKDDFINQAIEYKNLIKGSGYNKLLEFYLYWNRSHPLIAYRAYEISEFYKIYSEKSLAKAETEGMISDGESSSKLHEKIYITVKYEYIRPKSVFKLGGVFDSDCLEFKLGRKKYTVNKNDKITVPFVPGEYEVDFKNTKGKIKHHLVVKENKTIIISWNCDETKFNITEE